METKPYPIEFPARLSREEYIRSQELLSKNGGPMRFQRATLWLTAGLAVICLLALGVALVNGLTVDWSTYCMIGMLVVNEILMIACFPRIMRRRFGFAYDNTLFSGYTYNGMVQFDRVAITKRCEDQITYVSFAQCPLFVEAADMFIFCGTQGRHIVIPARYLTAADADALREAAFETIPAPRRRLVSRLVPEREERLPLSAIETDGEGPVLMVKMTLTKREWVSFVTDSVRQDLLAELPLKMVTGVTAASAGYLLFNVTPLPLFLLWTLLALLIPLLRAASETKKLIKLSDGQTLRWKVYFTDRKIHLRCDWQEDKILHVPWHALTRAVERPDYVDLYAHRKFVSIPKRCIADLEELRRAVDTYMPPRG